MVSAILRNIVSGLLVFTFCTAGLMKLTGKLAPQIHAQMKEEFVAFAKVHPLTKWFGRSVDSDAYRKTVGYIEIICALLLYKGAKPLKLLSSVVLLVVMAGAMQTLYWIGAPAAKFTPASVCAVLLLINVVMLLGEKPPKEKKRE